MTTPNDCHIDLRGLPFHYRDWGGDGRPVLLLHGLASARRITVPDAVMQPWLWLGRSGAPGYSTELMARTSIVVSKVAASRASALTDPGLTPRSISEI